MQLIICIRNIEIGLSTKSTLWNKNKIIATNKILYWLVWLRFTFFVNLNFLECTEKK